MHHVSGCQERIDEQWAKANKEFLNDEDLRYLSRYANFDIHRKSAKSAAERLETVRARVAGFRDRPVLPPSSDFPPHAYHGPRSQAHPGILRVWRRIPKQITVNTSVYPPGMAPGTVRRLFL